MSRISILRQILIATAIAAVLTPASRAQQLPNTGQQITPLAPREARFQALNPGLSDNPSYTAGQAVTSVVSPDGKTLLVLTSGYNLVKFPSGANEGALNAADSTQFVFVFDISKYLPVQKQVIQILNTYNGIVFDPSGTAFYVGGGVNDNVHAYALVAGVWAEQAGSPIALGHVVNPLTDGSGVGLEVMSQAAGVAITQDGTKLVVANYYNDSISILTKQSGSWAVNSELDLRPGKENSANAGVPGGEYPLWVVIKGNQTAYVSSIRDREIDVVDIANTPAIMTRIKVPGEPIKMVLNASQSTLYVAQDVTDSVGVIDTSANTLVDSIDVTAPAGLLSEWRADFKGSNTNSVTLSPDGKLLYVTNGWMNNVAVVQLSSAPKQSRVIGLIPTGWYPNSVSFSSDGKYTYVLNGKSPTGPNPGYCHGGVIASLPADQCSASNEYDLQLVKAGFQIFPTPSASELPGLTRQVAANNHFQYQVSPEDAEKLAFLHQKIHHIIYIIKENRTYDQILGDLEVGDGDPNLTEFGAATTPNFHNFASNFVTLDNFYDTSEVSMDGWPWSTAAHATDVVERQVTVEYAGRGLSYDSEGTNRNVNIGIPTLAGRLAANPLSPDDPDVLPGTTNTAAPDAADGEQGAGFLWNGALKARLSIRNYGFFIDEARYNLPAPYTALSIPELPDPTSTTPPTQVSYATSPALAPYTDIYFRGFDLTFPDYYRFTEWQRDFDAKYATGGLANLTLMRIMHDHTGNFSIAIDGINTPELDVADNDYAVGLVADKIAHGIYKNDTLIFVIEDDAQDGGDHVDAHRSTAFVIGPYVKQHAVVSNSYTTLSMFRTMEDILGIRHSNLNDALAVPMTDVFDMSQRNWTYKAVPSLLLYNTTLPLPPLPASVKFIPRPTHDAAYWAAVTQGMDFSGEDRVDGAKYNRILWQGLKGSKPYPATPSGLDLRANRAQLLALYRANSQQVPVQSSHALAAGTGGGQ
ncbi:MAG: bifunctional YncE family protein/alkaline phosphatase family protein [Terriglobia bacterium]